MQKSAESAVPNVKGRSNKGWVRWLDSLLSLITRFFSHRWNFRLLLVESSAC